jgi:hypothetical protein
MGLKYVNGPLTASVAQIKQDDQVSKTGYYSGTQTALVQPKATSATILGVNYKIDSTTLYYGMNTGDRLAVKSSSDGAKVESKGSRFAIKQTMGQIDLIASQTTQETTGAAADAKAKVTGLTGMYNLSKTSAVYLNYETYKTNLAPAAATATSTGDRKTVAIGMRKSF